MPSAITKSKKLHFCIKKTYIFGIFSIKVKSKVTELLTLSSFESESRVEFASHCFKSSIENINNIDVHVIRFIFEPPLHGTTV